MKYSTFSQTYLKIIAIAILVVFSILGCNRNNKVVLTLWAMGYEADYIKQLIKGFEADNPDITINLEKVHWVNAHAKIIQASEYPVIAPDICQIGNTWLPEIQATGSLLSLDSLIEESTIVNKESYFEGIWNTTVFDNKVLGIPWYVDTQVLIYRKDILKKAGYENPPENWNEWLQASQKISLLSSNKISTNALLLPLSWRIPVILILQNGGRIFSEDYQYAAFNNSATIESLRYYMSFYSNNLDVRYIKEFKNPETQYIENYLTSLPIFALGYQASEISKSLGELKSGVRRYKPIDFYSAFFNSKFAMMIGDPWNIHDLKLCLPDSESTWSTSIIPFSKYPYSLAEGSSLAIFKSSRHKTAAWKFIEYLSRPEKQVDFFNLSYDLPAIKEAWNFPELRNDDKIAAFRNQMDNLIEVPKIPEWEEVSREIEHHLLKTIIGQFTLETIIDSLNDDINKILAKGRAKRSFNHLAETTEDLHKELVNNVQRRMKNSMLQNLRPGGNKLRLSTKCKIILFEEKNGATNCYNELISKAFLNPPSRIIEIMLVSMIDSFNNTEKYAVIYPLDKILEDWKVNSGQTIKELSYNDVITSIKSVIDWNILLPMEFSENPEKYKNILLDDDKYCYPPMKIYSQTEL